MLRTAARIFVVLGVVSAFATAALAESRVALVIGNSNYAHVANLPNPRNDAQDLSQVLVRVGFEVTTATDLSYDSMRRTLRDFAAKASGADMALVFFAGHGMEVNKHNYLIPTDARLKTDRDIEYEAVPLDLVINAVSGARHLGLVMLDACRNNPFAASMKNASPTRSIGRGLARVEPSAGTLVSYAAKEGTVADDGDARNSPYTTALLAHLEQPGLEINFLFRRVRDSVFETTNGKQEPFTYGSLPGKQIYLKGPQAPDAKVAHNVPGPPAGVDRDSLFWSSVKDSNDPVMFEAYLDKFPDGLYAAIAVARLKQLSKLADPPANSPANSPADPPDEPPAAPPEKPADETAAANRVTRCDELAARRDDPANTLGVGVTSVQLNNHLAMAITMCRRAVADDPGNARLKYQLARALSESDQAGEAYELFLEAAEAGHAAAMRGVGIMYFRGHGVAEDHAEAMRWFRKSLDAGYAGAAISIGVLYHGGYGVPRDEVEAVRWYREAANGGNTTGMWRLGLMYRDGNGVHQDRNEAIRWIRKAAEAGDEWAMKSLGDLHSRGPESKRDYDEAARWYRLAAERGYGRGMTELAVAYLRGHGVQRDSFAALKWFRAAAEKKEPRAMTNIAMLYHHGHGAVSRDLAEALTWYRKAAELDDEVAMTAVGQMYLDGSGVPRDEAGAARWFRRAADAGEASAMTHLGVLYLRGDGVVRDYAAALDWFHKAAAKGELRAMANLGFVYEGGHGVARDNAEALRWYRKAADGGDTTAMNYLGLMYQDGTGTSRDYKQAAHWYRKAATGGNGSAMTNLGVLYSNGQGVSRDDDEAFRWFQKAADGGEAYGILNLSVMYNSGRGVRRDNAEAARLMLQVLKLGEQAAVKEMNTNSASWGRPFRSELQRLLKAAGVYQGAIDGSFGPATKRAIAQLSGGP
jgi:hypothetical protein